jgi:hydroxymethylpyrimidine/phosphomethylpyrimidine kinase
MKRYTTVLTIAGSDSGGGAGIQADLKTFSAMGCYGASVITAVTAQNTVGVRAIHPVPIDVIAEQIDAVLEDIGADAVKVGMLHSSAVIETVADRLRSHRVGNVVIDPVMVAKSGDRLLQEEAVQVLREVLLPLATVVTPNLPEAGVLLGREVQSGEGMTDAVRDLAQLGPQAVLLKGGHLGGEQSPDVLFVRRTEEVIVLDAPRVNTSNTHGTGCTLSSAIAACLAKGLDIEEAVRRAKAYLTCALTTGAEYQLGGGRGPVHHFHEYWR